jgi:hypothetical protein
VQQLTPGWHQESEHLSVEHRTDACDFHDVGAVFVDAPCPALWML